MKSGTFVIGINRELIYVLTYTYEYRGLTIFLSIRKPKKWTVAIDVNVMQFKEDKGVFHKLYARRKTFYDDFMTSGFLIVPGAGCWKTG